MSRGNPYTGANNVDATIIGQNNYIIDLSISHLLASLEILNISQQNLHLTKSIHDINEKILQNDIESLEVDKQRLELEKQNIEINKKLLELLTKNGGEIK